MQIGGKVCLISFLVKQLTMHRFSHIAVEALFFLSSFHCCIDSLCNSMLQEGMLGKESVLLIQSSVSLVCLIPWLAQRLE